MKQHGARQCMKHVHIHRWENFKNTSKTQSEIVHCLIPFSYETSTNCQSDSIYTVSTPSPSNFARILQKPTILWCGTCPTRSYPPCCCHTHPTTVIPPFLSPSPDSRYLLFRHVTPECGNLRSLQHSSTTVLEECYSVLKFRDSRALSLPCSSFPLGGGVTETEFESLRFYFFPSGCRAAFMSKKKQ